MKKIFFITTILLTSLFGVSQSPVTPTSTNTISVNGHADLKVKPDYIKAQINISNAYLEDGSTTQFLVDNFLQLLRKLNINSNQLKLENTTFTESYDTEIGKYENRTFSIVLNSSEQYDMLAQEILQLTGTTMYALEYSNSSPTKYIQEAYQIALSNCKENASYILGLNNLKLGEVVLIEDTSTNYTLPSPYYGEDYMGIFQPLEVTYSAQLRIVYSFTK